MAGQAAPAVKRTSHEAHTGGTRKEGPGQVNQTLRCKVMAENRHHAHFLNLEPYGKVKEFPDATEGSAALFEFAPVEGRPVMVSFDGGAISGGPETQDHWSRFMK